MHAYYKLTLMYYILSAINYIHFEKVYSRNHEFSINNYCYTYIIIYEQF